MRLLMPHFGRRSRTNFVVPPYREALARTSSPASTIEVLAEALKELYHADSAIRVIGTRHGEKLYETLVNREEMAKATELEHYYQIPADNRDLNYERYFSEGEADMEKINADFNSSAKSLFECKINSIAEEAQEV